MTDPAEKAEKKKAEAFASADSAVEKITTVGRYSVMGLTAASNILNSMSSMIARQAGSNAEEMCKTQLAKINDPEDNSKAGDDDSPDFEKLLSQGMQTCWPPISKKALKLVGEDAGEDCKSSYECKSFELHGISACSGYEEARKNEKGEQIPEVMGTCKEGGYGEGPFGVAADIFDLIAALSSPSSINECVTPKVDRLINIVPVQYYLMKILTAMLGEMGAGLADVKVGQATLVEQIKCGGQLEQLLTKKEVDLMSPSGLENSLKIPPLPYFKLPCTSFEDCMMRLIETMIVEAVCVVFCLLIEATLNFVAEGIYMSENAWLEGLVDYDPAKLEVGTFLGDKTLNGPELQKVDPLKYLAHAAFEEAWLRKYVSTSITKEEATTHIRQYLTAVYQNEKIKQRDIIMLFMGDATCTVLTNFKDLASAKDLNLESENGILQFWQFLGSYIDMLSFTNDSAPQQCPPEVCEIRDSVTKNTLDAINNMCDLLDPDFNILEKIDLAKLTSTMAGPAVRSGMGKHVGLLEMRIKEFILLENRSEKEPYLKRGNPDVSKWRFLRHIYDYRFQGSKDEHGPPRTIERGYLNTHHFLSVHRSGHPADFYEESFDPAHHQPLLMVYEPGHGFMQQHGKEYIKKWIDPKFSTRGWQSQRRSCIPIKEGKKVSGYGPGDLQISQISLRGDNRRYGQPSGWAYGIEGKTYYCKGRHAQEALEKHNHIWYQDVDGTFYIFNTKKKLWFFGIIHYSQLDGGYFRLDKAESGLPGSKTIGLGPINGIKYGPGHANEGKPINNNEKDNPFIKTTSNKLSSDFWKFRPLKKIENSYKTGNPEEYHVPYLVAKDATDPTFNWKHWNLDGAAWTGPSKPAKTKTALKEIEKTGNAAGAKNNILLCSLVHRQNITAKDPITGLGIPDPFYMTRLRKAFLQGFLPFLEPKYYKGNNPGEEFDTRLNAPPEEEINFFTDGAFGFHRNEWSKNDYWHKQVSPEKMISRYGKKEIKKLTKLYEDNSEVDDTEFIGLMNKLQKAALKINKINEETKPEATYAPIEELAKTMATDCWNDSDCTADAGNSNWFCANGKCRAIKPLGAPCKIDPECYPNKCTGNICVGAFIGPPAPPGK